MKFTVFLLESVKQSSLVCNAAAFIVSIFPGKTFIKKQKFFLHPHTAFAIKSMLNISSNLKITSMEVLSIILISEINSSIISNQNRYGMYGQIP